MTNLETKTKYTVVYSVSGVRFFATPRKYIEAYSEQEARLKALVEIRKEHREGKITIISAT